MTLRPTSKAAQQLLSMLWAEQTQAYPPRGTIHASTYRLLHLGYVERHADNLTVTLTASGRAAARTLAATPEGAAYLASDEPT